MHETANRKQCAPFSGLIETRPWLTQSHISVCAFKQCRYRPTKVKRFPSEYLQSPILQFGSAHVAHKRKIILNIYEHKHPTNFNIAKYHTSTAQFPRIRPPYPTKRKQCRYRNTYLITKRKKGIENILKLFHRITTLYIFQKYLYDHLILDCPLPRSTLMGAMT